VVVEKIGGVKPNERQKGVKGRLRNQPHDASES